MRFQTLALAWLLLGTVAQAQDDPDVTEEGLVRMPSSPKVGVYRLPEATFAQYRKVMIGPVEVVYKKGWERKHREMSSKDRERLRAQLAESMRRELIKELVDKGGFTLTDHASPDTLLVHAQVLDTDVIAPKPNSQVGMKTYVSSSGSMKMVVELHDAASNVLIGRLINYEMFAPEGKKLIPDSHRENWSMPASEISNLADFRVGFESSAKYTHEAINVARSEKREEQSQIKSEN